MREGNVFSLFLCSQGTGYPLVPLCSYLGARVGEGVSLGPGGMGYPVVLSPGQDQNSSEGTPPPLPPQTGPGLYSLHRGRYVFCGHAGGLSCYFIFLVFILETEGCNERIWTGIARAAINSSEL